MATWQRIDGTSRLTIQYHSVIDVRSLITKSKDQNEICLLILPSNIESDNRADEIVRNLAEFAGNLGPNAVLIIVGDVRDLVHSHEQVSAFMRYQLWISIKRDNPIIHTNNSSLPNSHFEALIYSRYSASLKHASIRIAYTYCPACQKTTKDYGGKKHTYNSYGTLMSDVWRDISCDYQGDLGEMVERFADLFAISPYSKLEIFDCRLFNEPTSEITLRYTRAAELKNAYQGSFANVLKIDSYEKGELLLGDCIENLRGLPDNSVDFAFVDPPYNLRKNYHDYVDDLKVAEYFQWCDDWISELSRVLKPGRTLAILNIPLWAIRHFLFMEQGLSYQNWITWDGLSYPVRKIMPANYSILCFSKGPARKLPGLIDPENDIEIKTKSYIFKPLKPLAEGYCLRQTCLRQRIKKGIDDRELLTDLWGDIHRLKHNTRRVDHPCQLPPQLLYRLISIFTYPGECVIDCFNGAGTTTLTAHQLGRSYIGIELSEKYHNIASLRHQEIEMQIDPFRKEQRALTTKNSPVERMPKRKYVIPKKTLQLEVRRVSQQLGRIPSRQDMISHGQYPISYYDEYFVSWGEVCAAARHDGMSETKAEILGLDNVNDDNSNGSTQLPLFSRGEMDAKR